MCFQFLGTSLCINFVSLCHVLPKWTFSPEWKGPRCLVGGRFIKPLKCYLSYLLSHILHYHHFHLGTAVNSPTHNDFSASLHSSPHHWKLYDLWNWLKYWLVVLVYEHGGRNGTVFTALHGNEGGPLQNHCCVLSPRTLASSFVLIVHDDRVEWEEEGGQCNVVLRDTQKGI